jgi:hypothetical protein
MKLVYHDTKVQPLNVLRKAGYAHFIDPNTKKPSFVLRTGPDFYPRYHLYVKEDDSKTIFDLHIDQKKAQYKGARAHNGEYDGPVVERELERIAKWVYKIHGIKPSDLPTKKPRSPQPEQPEPTKPETEPTDHTSGFNRIFGR